MRLQLEILLHPAAQWGGRRVTAGGRRGRCPTPARLPSWRRDPRLERNHGSRVAMAAAAAPPAMLHATAAVAAPPSVPPAAAATIANPPANGP